MKTFLKISAKVLILSLFIFNFSLFIAFFVHSVWIARSVKMKAGDWFYSGFVNNAANCFTPSVAGFSMAVTLFNDER